MSPFRPMTVRPGGRLRGRIRVPGDKSISHRYAMLAAIADGPSEISGYAPGADCAATLGCLGALGVRLQQPSRPDHVVLLEGRGLRGLAAPAGPLDARNSGTTMRLLAGLLAAHAFDVTIAGDASLMRRPMRRIVDPLTSMGARIAASGLDCPPLRIGPPARGVLEGITYEMPLASAQVKSAILLAGLQANGTTTVRERVRTRDHTEKALLAFGARVELSGGSVRLEGGHPLHGRRLRIPGDVSSAACFAMAAAARPGSDVAIEEIGLNPTRTAWVDVLKRAGARIETAPVSAGEAGGEPRGVLRVRSGDLRPMVVGADLVTAVIDEIPALAALATHGGELSVFGAAELRAKESDRITALVAGLRALGAEAEEWADGFAVRGRTPLRGGTADAAGDHRLAMAFAIAALGARAECSIIGAECVDVSYPGFFAALEGLRA